MRKLLSLCLAFAFLLPGCSPKPQQYSLTWMDLFDTVTTMTGMAQSEEEFREQTEGLYKQLQRYHRLFDIYNSYEGINNLHTVNAQAGVAPVQVDGAIIALLKDCRSYYELTDGRVNVAMGSVLRLWHEARQNGRLPDRMALEEAAKHTDFDTIVLDEEASTVFITDPQQSLDVGAIAKGWACQEVADKAPDGMLISVGGNVCAAGAKDTQGTPWRIAVQDPADASVYLHILSVTGGAVVTSGDYQRTVTIDGVAYHHIIDPDTLMPAAFWRSVTVVCEDSALADALSTALFLLPLEAGRTLAEACGADALWVDDRGAQHMTDGFPALVAQ